MRDIFRESIRDLGTDHAWEEWGRRDPYFGVITDPRYRRAEITEQSKLEFFLSGSNHVDYVMQTIRQFIVPDFAPATVLDFGCGVGRTLIPFAEKSQHVVGADVSDAMLKEARKNCDVHRVTNVSLVHSDDSLSSATGTFDLVHSFIVFQHIPVDRGRLIFHSLLNRIAAQGVGAIHVLYSKAQFAETHGVAPVAGRSAATPSPAPIGSENPEMQMNPYSMNELLFFIQRLGVRRIHTEFTDHGGELGVFMFFQLS
jgi:SAM-dependent methyltransferase